MVLSCVSCGASVAESSSQFCSDCLKAMEAIAAADDFALHPSLTPVEKEQTPTSQTCPACGTVHASTLPLSDVCRSVADEVIDLTEEDRKPVARQPPPFSQPKSTPAHSQENTADDDDVWLTIRIRSPPASLRKRLASMQELGSVVTLSSRESNLSVEGSVDRRYISSHRLITPPAKARASAVRESQKHGAILDRGLRKRSLFEDDSAYVSSQESPPRGWPVKRQGPSCRRCGSAVNAGCDICWRCERELEDDVIESF